MVPIIKSSYYDGNQIVIQMKNGAPITVLLQRVSSGDQTAESELFAAIYPNLRNHARRLVAAERPGHTLQPTALISEAYLRMIGSLQTNVQDRAHFFRIAAKVMHHVLVDYANRRNAAKRTGGIRIPDFDEQIAITDTDLDTVLAVDAAMARLSQQDARQAQVVEMRFFGGLTEEEIGLVLGKSTRTIKRDWDFAKAWLKAELSSKARATNA